MVQLLRYGMPTTHTTQTKVRARVATFHTWPRSLYPPQLGYAAAPPPGPPKKQRTMGQGGEFVRIDKMLQPPRGKSPSPTERRYWGAGWKDGGVGGHREGGG